MTEKLITYGEHVMALYKSLVKRKLDGRGYAFNKDFRLVQMPGDTQMYVLAQSKKHGEKLYPVSSFEALACDEDFSRVGYRNVLHSAEDLDMPVTDFVPGIYRVHSASLRDGLHIHRLARNWHSGELVRLQPRLTKRLEEQVRGLGK